MAKKIENLVGTNKAYFNKRNRKDKCNHSISTIVNRFYTTIDMDRRRNCYNCGGFEYLVRDYRNQRIVGQEKRIEYGNNCNTK